MLFASIAVVISRCSSAIDNRTGEMVAIKKMTNVFGHPLETKRTLREVQQHTASAAPLIPLCSFVCCGTLWSTRMF